jgi:hypothetical protein
MCKLQRVTGDGKMSLELKARTTKFILGLPKFKTDNAYLEDKWVPFEDYQVLSEKAQKLEHTNIALAFALEAEQKMRTEVLKILEEFPEKDFNALDDWLERLRKALK